MCCIKMSSLPSGNNPLANQRGYALYLVLVVLSISGILFTVSLKSSSLAQIAALNLKNRMSAKLNALSGMERAEYFLNGGDGHDFTWETEKFYEEMPGAGSFEIICSRFGVLKKTICTGKRLKQQYTVNAIMGRDLPKNIAGIITLTGHVGGLVLDGGTTLKGTVVLHHGAVKRGKNKSSIPGSDTWTKNIESPSLPFDKKPLETLFAVLPQKLNGIHNDTLKTSSSTHITNAQDTLLKASPVLIQGDLTIAGCEIDNTEFIVSGNCTIEGNALLKRVAIYADKITVRDGTTVNALLFAQSGITVTGGEHRSQFLANDTIIISKEGQCHEGTILISHRIQKNDTLLSGGITLAPGSVFDGHIICYSDSLINAANVRSGASITLGERSTVIGTIITDGDIDTKNIQLKGVLWARSIITMENEISYKNWLIGSPFTEYRPPYPFPLIGELPAEVSYVE